MTQIGVCYYPEHWPRERWAQDAAQMVQLGITWVRIGEFAWSCLEPEPGRYEWAWLDEAMEILAKAGLKIVLGTPTATPPKWLIDRHPDILPVDPYGRRLGFGSRRHYCLSNQTYRQACAQIVTAIATRYGEHPALAGWQIDNEYGCHGGADHTYAPAVRDGFRRWLKVRYQTIDALNQAWGTVFWSMTYNDFDQIDLPAPTVAETAPAHRLDFYRFTSQEVVDFQKVQVDVLRTHSPGRFISHNFMGFSPSVRFDHYPVGKDIDVATWDSYPLGFAEMWLDELSDEARIEYARTGHPDAAAMHHDLYRAVGRGRFWIMEQQPGPVNWARWNPAPAPGMVRLWAMEAAAHGAEVVSYFRWRQVPFAQEHMHAGLLYRDGTRAPGGDEAQQAARDLAILAAHETNHDRADDRVKNARAEVAEVAMVFDYQAAWVTAIAPHGQDFRYFELFFLFYNNLRSLGLSIDIIPPGEDLSGYALVVIPTMPLIDEARVRALSSAEHILILGPRTGAYDPNFSIPTNGAPGALYDLMGVRVRRCESMRPGLTRRAVYQNTTYDFHRWTDFAEPGAADIELIFTDGRPAITRHKQCLYLTAWPAPDFARAWLLDVARQAGLDVQVLAGSLRRRRRNGLIYYLNYGAQPVKAPIPAGADIVLGAPTIPPHDLTVVKDPA
ncbi:MAG: beta-galactosidase [Pseudomonadota bacterium]